MKTLTVITTTYNRGYCIKQVYDSLAAQDCKDFVWLVIDDGSTDNTRQLIQQFAEEDKIEIRYHFQDNRGMHAARNLGYELADTELNVIIDSDDWMAPGAVGKIVEYWKTNKTDGVAGMISLNADPSGAIIGTEFPEGVKRCSYKDFFKKYKMQGDHKLIYRTELTKKYPYPVFENEKFYPASYKFYLIDKEYDLLLFDCVTCIVNYTDNSMTRDKYAQYKTCPRGFMHYRKAMLQHKLGIKSDVKNMMHYVMECSIAKATVDSEILRKPLFYLCCIPGKLFYFYITHTKKKY